MILIIRQVTKVKTYFEFTGLILLLAGVILTSCNSYIKPDENRTLSVNNDTVFLAEVYNFSKYIQELSGIANQKIGNKEILEFIKENALFHNFSESKWGSLSRIKNIELPENLSESYKNSLIELDKTRSENFEKVFISHLENKLLSHIEMVEAYSKRSEDNELITLSVSLLTGMHQQLNTLVSLRDKIAAK